LPSEPAERQRPAKERQQTHLRRRKPDTRCSDPRHLSFQCLGLLDENADIWPFREQLPDLREQALHSAGLTKREVCPCQLDARLDREPGQTTLRRRRKVTAFVELRA